jgi:Golgi nucleoside diphosphatase
MVNLQNYVDGNLKLDDELFVQVKPGLSAFSGEPKKGASQMLALLEQAKTVVPPSERGHTPLAMKATAGLRLLPKNKADQLIEEVNISINSQLKTQQYLLIRLGEFFEIHHFTAHPTRFPSWMEQTRDFFRGLLSTFF